MYIYRMKVSENKIFLCPRKKKSLVWGPPVTTPLFCVYYIPAYAATFVECCDLHHSRFQSMSPAVAR